MSQHVYARLSGFGWTLLPLAPFRFERVPGRPDSLAATHFAPGGPRRANLTFTADGPAVELAGGTQRVEEILDLLPGPGLDHWAIETTVFTVGWPASFALGSSPDPPGFELLGPGRAMVYVQGPFPRPRLPTLDAMAAPGQAVRRQGRTARWAWVELEYRHEGTPWRQTHRVVDFRDDQVCVVTSQAPLGQATPADAAADEVAASLTPFGGEGS
jgi:hypothetical protein